MTKLSSHQVIIRTGASGFGSIFIDGVEISRVTGVKVTITAGRRPMVVISVIPEEVIVEAEVLDTALHVVPYNVTEAWEDDIK